jgi:hypothetical protein
VISFLRSTAVVEFKDSLLIVVPAVVEDDKAFSQSVLATVIEFVT